MKYRVVGWASYDDRLPQADATWAAYYAIVDEIKKCGYSFSGWSHQEGYCCAPVLNDGKMYLFSQRGWGGLMAEAHGYTGRMDYCMYAFMTDMDSLDKEIRPKNKFDRHTFKPERDLNEKFELEVSQEIFDAAKTYAIKLDDLPQLRYMDAGDTLSLTCGEQGAEYIVSSVDRDKDISHEKLIELQVAFSDFKNKERKQRAEEEFDNAKIVLTVKFSKPQK